MANFREHIGFGFVVAILVTGAFLFYSVLSGVGLSTALFAAIVLGSFMPDLDSDTSIVFSIIFSLTTAVAMGLTFYWVFLTYGSVWQPLVLSLAISLIVMWLIVRPLFKKMTTHRGMFHSIPALFIAGFIGYHITLFISESDVIALWFGIGLAIGYLAHLILDEIHSGINLDGTPFRPNHMLGTALKLYGGDMFDNILTYTILGAFIVFTFL